MPGGDPYRKKMQHDVQIICIATYQLPACTGHHRSVQFAKLHRSYQPCKAGARSEGSTPESFRPTAKSLSTGCAGARTRDVALGGIGTSTQPGICGGSSCTRSHAVVVRTSWSVLRLCRHLQRYAIACIAIGMDLLAEVRTTESASPNPDILIHGKFAVADPTGIKFYSAPNLFHC